MSDRATGREGAAVAGRDAVSVAGVAPVVGRDAVSVTGQEGAAVAGRDAVSVTGREGTAVVGREGHRGEEVIGDGV